LPRVTVVTFNAGLLRAFGGLLEPAPFVSERRAAIPHALAACGADLVLLQEVHDETSRRAISLALPNQAYDARWRSSLMALSTSPIRAALVPFRDSTLEERLFDCRGVLVVERGDLVALNFHTTAGGLRHHPESVAADAIRARQIEQLLDVADEQRAPLVVIAGDLNAGPGVSQSNYDRFEQRGWIDVHALLHPGSRDVTWDPHNPLNSSGPHRTSPPQRVDHLFVRQCDVNEGRATPHSSEIIFAHAVVATPAGAMTLSDHYALRVTLGYHQAAK
jgi:endonuclease/exonuclease/phosphatase family metal-dependent hydrolase